MQSRNPCRLVEGSQCRFASRRISEIEYHALLDDYRSLELRASELMHKICMPFCRVCPTPCCKVSFCREASESPFLAAIHGGKPEFDDNLGYLGSNGCKMGAGRPPVCHAFVCSRILDAQPTDMHRYALECLGDLVGFVGKKVWRGKHLVEAPTADDLHDSNPVRFRDQMEIAEAALLALNAFFNQGQKMQTEELRVLSQVKKARGVIC